jgi:hypothetical protein
MGIKVETGTIVTSEGDVTKILMPNGQILHYHTVEQFLESELVDVVVSDCGLLGGVYVKRQYQGII